MLSVGLCEGLRMTDSDWKELKIDKCSEWPDDLTTRTDLEWQFIDCSFEDGSHESDWDKCSPGEEKCMTWPGIVRDLIDDSYRYRYRLRQPKLPTYKEKMTNWWNFGGIWLKVAYYEPTNSYPYRFVECRNFDGWANDDWFIGRESRTIPPEKS